MQTPEISVLITVYNGERFLRETILSVLSQTFKNFELIIVNDGSTDKTEKIIKEFMKKDKRIVYLKNPINKGYDNLHNIINMGLEIAKGKYIARLDADDVCYPERLNVQKNYLDKNKDIFLIGSSADIIEANGSKIGEIKKMPWPSFVLKYRIGFSNPLVHSSIMFRNENFKYIHRNEHVFYFNLIFHGKKLKNIRRTLVKYRINPNGIVSQHSDISTNKYKDYYIENKK
jgi:glycosyltransferase involved in cell wall biosynthesis